jgi:hypothetical protein
MVAAQKYSSFNTYTAQRNKSSIKINDFLIVVEETNFQGDSTVTRFRLAIITIDP